MGHLSAAEDKNLIAASLLEASKDGRLPKSKTVQVAAVYEVEKRTIYVIWAKVKHLRCQGQSISFKSNKRAKQISVHFDEERMKAIPFKKRNTIRNVAHEMGVSKSTVGRWKEIDVIRPHTNAIKPTLTPENEIARLRYCLDAITIDCELGKPIFKPMTNVVHYDKKWFNMTKEDEKYYICPGEEEHHGTCQSKRYIIKVMFFCAMSRPIYTENGELIFDGKIGIWPFTKTEPAKRRSIHRPAGTLVTKPLEWVNKEVTKAMLINHVIPAIKSKWPSNLSKDITIQWDNSPPHIKNDDPDFRKKASSDGFNINLIFQPPNSPDTNINDLGYFRSIESIKIDRTVDDLVEGVQES